MWTEVNRRARECTGTRSPSVKVNAFFGVSASSSLWFRLNSVAWLALTGSNLIGSYGFIADQLRFICFYWIRVFVLGFVSSGSRELSVYNSENAVLLTHTRDKWLIDRLDCSMPMINEWMNSETISPDTHTYTRATRSRFPMNDGASYSISYSEQNHKSCS